MSSADEWENRGTGGRSPCVACDPSCCGCELRQSLLKGFESWPLGVGSPGCEDCENRSVSCTPRVADISGWKTLLERSQWGWWVQVHSAAPPNGRGVWSVVRKPAPTGVKLSRERQANCQAASGDSCMFCASGVLGVLCFPSEFAPLIPAGRGSSGIFQCDPRHLQ